MALLPARYTRLDSVNFSVYRVTREWQSGDCIVMPEISRGAWGIGILLCTDAALFIVGRMIVSSNVAQSSKGISMTVAMSATAVALLIHLFAVGVAAGMGRAFGDPGGMLSYLGISVLTGAGPAIVFGYMNMQSAANLGNALVSGEEKDAIERFDRAKALALLKEGKVEAAMAEYQLQARAFPESSEPLTALANLQEHQGQLENAAATWREVRDRFPHDAVAQRQVASHLAYIGRNLARQREGLTPEGAGEVYDYNAPEEDTATPEKVGKAPVVVPRNMDMAHRLARQGDTDHAVRVYRDYYRSLVEPDARVLFALVSVLQQAERYEEAKTVLQEIGRTFNADERTWAKAMLNLATLLHGNLFDTSSAQYILKQIRSRMPGTEQAATAWAQLKALEE